MKEPGSGKNAAARLLCLPGESGWELWSISAASREKLPDAPKEAQAAPAGASIGLPVRHATIVSLWLQSADPGLFRELIAAQLERLDLLRNASTPWTHLPSARDGERTLVTAYILDPDLPPALLCPGARTYDVSARCRPLPKEGWAVWREEGGIVAACSRGGCLVAAHFFPGTSVFGEIAPDLASLVRSLVWEKIALPDAPCVLWGAFPEADSAQASAVFRSPASAVPVPPPILPEPPLGLLPSPIRAQQQARSQGKRRQTLYLYAAVAYLLAAGAALAGLGWLK